MGTHERAAIITGAGSGIGKAAALAFLKDGYRVALAGRREEALAQVAAESGAGSRALVVPTDVTNPDSVQRAFRDDEAELRPARRAVQQRRRRRPAAALDDVTFEQWQPSSTSTSPAHFLCTQRRSD